MHDNKQPIVSAYSSRVILLAYVALFSSPMLFSSNIIFGKLVVHIAPFTLAFLRWTITAAILLMLTRRHHAKMWEVTKSHYPLLLCIAFLAMFICGGLVYLGLQTTSATNATLIYTMPPVLIIVIERIWRKRPMRIRESFGVIIAIIGVTIIVTKASFENLMGLSFSLGDLLFVVAAISWAIYTVLVKNNNLEQLDTLSMFALLAVFGSVILMPVSVYEIIDGQTFPSNPNDWMVITGIVVISSLLSFSVYQFGIKILGPSIAGISMYLLPLYGVAGAWYLLGESLEPFHILGILTVLGGVILATFPKLNSKNAK